MSGAVTGSRYNFSRGPGGALTAGPGTGGGAASAATPAAAPRLMGSAPYTAGGTAYATSSRYTTGSMAGASSAVVSSYGGAAPPLQQSAFKGYTPARPTFDEVASSHAAAGSEAAVGGDLFSWKGATPHQPSGGSRF